MTVLAGRYRIDREVGRGAMGVVYLDYDERLDRAVALKELLLQSHLTPELRREMAGRFDHEARAAGRLNHPNIVSVYDVLADEDHSYIVMEYVEGETLDALLARGPLDADSAAAIAVQVLQAIGHAHSHSVIHRDLKPENVFVQANGSVKVTDFGIAHVGDTAVSWTRAGTIVGTVGYMSPEQLRGEPVDQRTDVFAVGVLLYELLTGMNPFGADTQTAVMYRIAHEEPPALRSLRAGAPKYLDAVIRKAVHKDRDQRYQSAADMAFDLLHRKAPKVRPATLVPPPPVARPIVDSARAAGPSRTLAPTVIGAPSGASADAASSPVLPPGLPPGANVGADDGAASEEPAAMAWQPVELASDPHGGRGDSHGSSRLKGGMLVAVVAVAVAVAITMGVLLLSSGGVQGETGATGVDLVGDARLVNDAQSRLARTVAAYSHVTAGVSSLAQRNRAAISTWKSKVDDYKDAQDQRKADVRYNSSQAKKDRPASVTPGGRDPVTNQPLPGHTTAAYVAPRRTLTTVPPKPLAPPLDLQPLRAKLGEVRVDLAHLMELVGATRVGPQLTPLMTQVGTVASSASAAEQDSSEALKKAVETRMYRGLAYRAVAWAELEPLGASQDLKAEARAIRVSLLDFLRANQLSAGDLRPEASRSPSPSTSPGP